MKSDLAPWVRRTREDYMKKLLTLVAVLAFAGSALAQTAHKVIRVEDVAWVDHPFFKGAKSAILVGDPTKAEGIVQRVKFPPHYRVPPHTHPYAEIVTVATGSSGTAIGENIELKVA